MIEDINFFIPEDIPAEISKYDIPLTQLGVGKAGKVGALQLKLEKDKHTRKTIVKEQYSRVPLLTQRALYLEETMPSMAYMYVISPSGGILQGDRYRIDISLKNNACAHITTQGATRIYKMNQNYATQIININVDEGCYFEYIPDQIIPYRNSRFYQKVMLNVHDDATGIYTEIIVPGRKASGEVFEYDICYMRAVAKNFENDLKIIDNVILQPVKQNLKVLGIFGSFDTVGSMYILNKSQSIQILNKEINDLFKEHNSISGGSSILPQSSGILVRVLGNGANDIRNIFYKIIDIVRKEILGVSFSGIRKG